MEIILVDYKSGGRLGATSWRENLGKTSLKLSPKRMVSHTWIDWAWETQPSFAVLRICTPRWKPRFRATSPHLAAGRSGAQRAGAAATTFSQDV